MSRIGKEPVVLPDGVDFKVDGAHVTVKGPKGTLERDFSDLMSFTVEDGTVVVVPADDERDTRALHGLSRALLNNMVVGVTEGYRRELQTVGVGYRANLQGRKLELAVGFSHPVHIEAPDGVDFEVPDPTKIIVSGIDKEAVGQTAANIRRVRPPEPYKGKGIRYAGEHVRRKTGKAGI
jgi:large subunit ribosomal protein L6